MKDTTTQAGRGIATTRGISPPGACFNCGGDHWRKDWWRTRRGAGGGGQVSWPAARVPCRAQRDEVGERLRRPEHLVTQSSLWHCGKCTVELVALREVHRGHLLPVPWLAGGDRSKRNRMCHGRSLGEAKARLDVRMASAGFVRTSTSLLDTKGPAGSATNCDLRRERCGLGRA